MIGGQNQRALIVARDALGGDDRRERLAQRFELRGRLRDGLRAGTACQIACAGTRRRPGRLRRLRRLRRLELEGPSVRTVPAASPIANSLSVIWQRESTSASAFCRSADQASSSAISDLVGVDERAEPDRENRRDRFRDPPHHPVVPAERPAVGASGPLQSDTTADVARAFTVRTLAPLARITVRRLNERPTIA